MCRTIFMILPLLLLSVGFALSSDPTEVVIFYSSCDYDFDRDACDNLGWSYDAYGAANEADFRNDVANGADIVIFNCPSDYEDASLDTLEDYVVNDDGILVLCFWDMSYLPGHNLWDAMEVTYVSEYVNVLPVYIWDDTHDIFNTPNDLTGVGSFTFNDNWTIDGQKVEPQTKGEALAGYTGTEQTNQSALVINDNQKTAFNGFAFDEGGDDNDADGKVDIVELIENELVYLWNDGNEHLVQPTSVGKVKAMFE